jgi:hypothetical protein
MWSRSLTGIDNCAWWVWLVMVSLLFACGAPSRPLRGAVLVFVVGLAVPCGFSP